MVLDYKLFESNQEYHNKFKDIDIPYNDSYYDNYMKEYLDNNIPNEFILVNYFSKLYCSTDDTEYAIEDLIEPLGKFSHITITNELFVNIIENMHQPKKPIVDYNNFDVMYRGLSVLDVLLSICNYNITLDNLYNQLHFIDFNKLNKLNKSCDYDNIKNKLPQTIKKIFTLVYNKNPNSLLNLNTFEYIIKYNMIEQHKPSNINQYKLLYKYEKSINRLKSYKNFTPDIECLQNACTIKDNTTVVKNLLKSIEPNSICLSNALEHIDNKIIYLLLEKINPTVEQIIQYCELKNDSVTKLLVQQL